MGRQVRRCSGCNNAVAGPYYNFTVPEPTGVVGVVAPTGPRCWGWSRCSPVVQREHGDRARGRDRARAVREHPGRGDGDQRRPRGRGEYPDRRAPNWCLCWRTTGMGRGARGGRRGRGLMRNSARCCVPARGESQTRAGAGRPGRRGDVGRLVRSGPAAIRGGSSRLWSSRPSGTPAAV